MRLIHFGLAAALTGCAILQSVEPVREIDQKYICIIENAKVREGFLKAYAEALVNRGFEVRVLDGTASVSDCPITSSYTAEWNWDLAIYMSYANIQIYEYGELVGEVVYSSKRGGGNLGKFVDAESKIKELVYELFPYHEPKEPEPSSSGEDLDDWNGNAWKFLFVFHKPLLVEIDNGKGIHLSKLYKLLGVTEQDTSLAIEKLRAIAMIHGDDESKFSRAVMEQLSQKNDRVSPKGWLERPIDFGAKQ